MVHCRVNWTYTSSMASVEEDNASKAPPKKGQESVCHFIKGPVAVNMHVVGCKM